MAIHQIEAEPEVYGAAAFLIVVHLLRNLAARDARTKRQIRELLDHAAADADKLGNDFGRQVAALIRRVHALKPLADSRPKH